MSFIVQVFAFKGAYYNCKQVGYLAVRCQMLSVDKTSLTKISVSHVIVFHTCSYVPTAALIMSHVSCLHKQNLLQK